MTAGDQRRGLTQWIDDSAGLGALRAEALVTMLRPFDCMVRAARGVTGLRSVQIYGPTSVVDYLRDHLDGWLAELDAAAKAATRRYGAWLRDQDEPDHMPAERRNLTRAYRRQYVPAWAAAWAVRLDDLVRGHDPQPGDAPAVGHTSAHAAAGHDVMHLDPRPLSEVTAVIRANHPRGRGIPAAGTSPSTSVHPDGPGRIAPGQRVTCLPGSLPARDGGRGGGLLVSIGVKTSVVDVYGGHRRRISNQLLHPEAGCFVAADRNARGLRTTNASGRGWLPGWSWLGWTVAEHLEYIRGERRLPVPPPAPRRLVILACGARKAACFEAPAGDMYVGSYHRAARRAADALTTPGTRVMILSARYGLLNLDDVILRYEMRLGQRYAITKQGLREQAEQLGLAGTAEVIVLAPGGYAELAAHVWPHAQLPLAGTRGIGEQMARLTALATGKAAVADLVDAPPGTTVPQTTMTAPGGDEHLVSIRGGLVHLADTPPGRGGALAPMCPADQPGRQWRLTHAPITCTRCAAIVTRRRALDRWCAMVDRGALSTDIEAAASGPAACRPKQRRRTSSRPGPAPRRPAGGGGRSESRRPPPRRPGEKPRRRHRDGWRHVPTPRPLAVPLKPPTAPATRRRPRIRSPRAPIGRAPPRPCGARPGRMLASGHLLAGHRPDAGPLTPHKPLARENNTARNTFANGASRPSGCTTRPSPTGGVLADPQLRTGMHRPDASTSRPDQAAPDRCVRTAQGLDRTLEVRPVTDLTVRPDQAGTSGPAPASPPANGAAVTDVRTLRRISRAEQERLSADADLERRARAARLDLELREQQRAAARQEREADVRQKQARAEQRRTRRAARRARLRAAAPLWADRALLVLPIIFPMAVAWVGQIRFAMTVMGWPLAAAIVFAAGFELSTAYVARLDWLSRAAGDSALLFRGATWGFAGGAATMNYWHAAGPAFAPNGEAVSYGLMSITGVVLWELLSTYRHRTALRAEGKLPAARPRFGISRWIWFHRLTRLAWLLTLRDGHPTTDLAWRAALIAIDRYGSAKAAREAVRDGRPVPLPDDERDNADETAGHRDDGTVGTAGEWRDGETGREDRTGTEPRVERDGSKRDAQRESRTGRADRDTGQKAPREQRPESGAKPGTRGGSRGARRDPGETRAVSAKMLAYARERLAQGATVTGADLDRQFGTSDYGRKVLRRLATEPGTVND
jgi:hypothetical protein